ncbi:hypothetical protein [Catenovulum maritimum]|uniref:Right handed beta helix domain-containing protein n=1 Tax=Catenovulum maritimum TaxID=1513271 RepID=A0A0J8GTJ9_9ALTE|nr:hypothetical protein [Catenovulum maritimum]KMT64639.1 hypothetical protein XM47_13445 [Catenovulum maritimum]
MNLIRHLINLFTRVSCWTLCLLCFSSQAFIKNNEIIVDGISYQEVKKANQAIKDNSQVYIGPGIYITGMHIKSNNVTITGSANTHFINAVIKDKGTFVVSGDDVTIENIECSQVKASSNNGACIRQEGKDLTVLGVNFHNSQQGILQNPKTNSLTIRYSRFENLGKAGRAHAIYAQGESLLIKDSVFLSSKDQGHEIKARSRRVVIEDTLIASLTGNDSRLIDISNGGELTINNCILQQGNSTVNKQAIGFGLEGTSPLRKNSIEITKSLIILERERGNTFLALPKEKSGIKILVNQNVIVGKATDTKHYQEGNSFYNDRLGANLSSYQLPEINNLPLLLEILNNNE